MNKRAAAYAHHDVESIKKVLKRVYMAVHPDLFGQHPEKQSVNETSLQELQGAFDDFAAGEKGPPRYRKREVVFYVRESGEQGAAKPDGSYAAGLRSDRRQEAFRKVAVKFGAPGGFVRSLEALLWDVLKEKIVANSGGGEATHDGDPPGAHDFDMLSFLDGMDGASHKSREILSRRTTEEKLRDDDMDESRVLALHLQRRLGLRLEFNSALQPALRPGLVRRVAGLVDRLDLAQRDALSGGRVVVDSGFEAGMVAKPYGASYLRLGACATESLWLEHLGSESLRDVFRESAQHRSNVKDAENEAARVLGVRFVLTDQPPVDGWSAEYLQLLSKLSVGAPPLDESLSGVSIMVLAEKTTFNADADNGVLSVPLGAGEEKIRAFIGESGPTLAQSYGARLRERELEDHLQHALRRSTRVRRVRRHENLSRPLYNAACRRLIRHGHAFRTQLEGLQIVIGHDYNLDEDDGTITIPHDFTARFSNR